jgi:hypothetical protein
MENIVVKAGWLLVEFMPTFSMVELSMDMCGGKIISGANEIGMFIFFKEMTPFSGSGKYCLVKMDDVLAWIKPEVKEDEKKEGNSEGSESSTVA